LKETKMSEEVTQEPLTETVSKEPKAKAAKGRTLLMVEPETLVIAHDVDDPLYDERGSWPINEPMVKNIMVHGVLVPLIARRNGDKLEVEDGRQRVINSCEANRRLKKEGSHPIRIPVDVIVNDDKRAIGVMVSANEQRRGDTIITKAHKMQRMITLHGMTEDEVATEFGCVTASVKNYLLLLECAKPIQDAVQKGKLSADIAKKMAKLPKKEQVEALEKLMEEGATKGKKAKKALARATKGKAESEDVALTKKEIKNLFEALKGTAKATKGSEEPGLLEGIKLLEHVLGKRVNPPFAIVEVSAGGEEEEGEKSKVDQARQEERRGCRGLCGAQEGTEEGGA
jgi:ParB family transcriptional regulator, chromosome partitioning protein